jgi:hypothetical protein
MAATTEGTNLMNSPSASPEEVVLGIALGYLVSRGLHVAAELGIADQLKGGAKDISDLARVTGAHQETLYRLLRMLAGHGVFTEESPGRFNLSPAAALLQSEVPGSLLDAVKMIGDMAGDGSWWNAVGNLRQTVLTGKPGFDSTHGVGFFEYLIRHPDAGEWFDRGLGNFSTAENSAIVSAYDFTPFKSVVDVGGGQGGFLAELLNNCPGMRGTLFDLPRVVQKPTYLNAAELTNRCDIVTGDFFASPPPAADAYILKRILHDWNDVRCVQILRNCREAMRSDARLLVVDAVVPPGNTPHPSKVMDILMMVLLEGRERTEEEFRGLYEQAGLTLTRVVPTPSVLSIVDGERRS